MPVTVSVGDAEPEKTTPFTDVGVIASRDREISGAVVGKRTVPLIPFAGVIETDVTLPVPVLPSVIPYPAKVVGVSVILRHGTRLLAGSTIPPAPPGATLTITNGP